MASLRLFLGLLAAVLAPVPGSEARLLLSSGRPQQCLAAGPAFWGIRGGGSSSEAPSAPKSGAPPGYVCDGDVCYPKPAAGGVPSVKGGAADGNDKPSAFTNRPHKDYFTTQVEKLASKGHSKADAEAAFKEAKYDLEKAAALLKDGFHSGPSPSSPPASPQPTQAPPKPDPLKPAAPTPEASKKPVESKVPEASKKPEGKEGKAEGKWPEESLKALEAKGLERATAQDVLDMTKGDLQAAYDIVSESQSAADLEAAVEVMVQEGWDEDVARQALLSQREKMRERGEDVAAPLPVQAKPAPAPTPAPKPAAKPAAAAGAKKPEAGPKPANKADVVFEGTEADLQKLIIESPVPVLLDVYADWCGPCKQLTPALEEMAVKAGGLFRVVKLNSEKNRGIVDMLNVEGLPTVFGVRDGQIQDRFVGMPQQAALQSFMMQLVTGAPRAEPDPLKSDKYTLTNSELKAFSNKLQHFAGLAAFGSRKKEALEIKVDALIQETLAVTPESPEAAVTALRTVGKYLQNVFKNPGEKKFRSIDTSKPGYQSMLAPYPPATEILRRVGFKEEEGQASHVLTLQHRNQAPLIAADTIIGRFLTRRQTQGRAPAAAAAQPFRARSMRNPGPSKPAPPATPPVGFKPKSAKPLTAAKPAAPTPAAASKPTAAAKPTPPKPAAPVSKTCKLTLTLPAGGSVVLELSPSDSLSAAFAKLRESRASAAAVKDAKAIKLLLRGAETRTFSENSAEAKGPLSALKLGSEAVLRVVLEGAPKKAEDPKKAEAKKTEGKKKRGGVHTLYSEGHLEEDRGKGNRYYGGGSTYFEAAVDEEEKKEEKEENEEEDEEEVAEGEEEEDEEEEEEEEEEEGSVEGEGEEEEDEEEGDEEDDAEEEDEDEDQEEEDEEDEDEDEEEEDDEEDEEDDE